MLIYSTDTVYDIRCSDLGLPCAGAAVRADGDPGEVHAGRAQNSPPGSPPAHRSAVKHCSRWTNLLFFLMEKITNINSLFLLGMGREGEAKDLFLAHRTAVLRYDLTTLFKRLILLAVFCSTVQRTHLAYQFSDIL